MKLRKPHFHGFFRPVRWPQRGGGGEDGHACILSGCRQPPGAQAPSILSEAVEDDGDYPLHQPDRIVEVIRGGRGGRH